MPLSSGTEAELVGLLHEAAETLLAFPADTEALGRVATSLTSLGEKDAAAVALEALGQLGIESGQVALGVAAVKLLERLGQETRAWALLSSLAHAFALGSPRVDPALPVRPRVPPPPKKGPPGAPRITLKVAKEKAKAAVAKVVAKTSEAPRTRPKLPCVPILGSVDAALFQELVSVMDLGTRAKGDVVMEVGEEARSLFLVARGALRVTRGEHELAIIRAGAFFGEIALLSGTTRTARVACLDETWLLEVPREALEAAAAKSPRLADTIASHAKKRLLANTMRTSDLFAQLASDEREVLVGRFTPSIFEAGATILKEGQDGDRLYVIVSGDAWVYKGSSVVAELHHGDLFGEASLITRKPAAANVVATTRTVTLSLDRASFNNVALKHPALLAEVYKTLIEREAVQTAASVSTSPFIIEPDETVV
ncbi:MAG: cyclic nucleotide-binding domain-containing protein [Deltaproteobacteria bacterium]|nr:cyclic nucleotide-binding domain-containing protein [Deltaproteobacteria bacterium]